MGDAKHTPGPWRTHGGHYVEAGDNDIIMDALPRMEAGARKANARLAAAAPDLLEALEVMLRGDRIGEAESQRRGLPRLSERWEMARAAIAKARGDAGKGDGT